MDLLTKADLDLLAERGRPEVCVSLFIPTHAHGVDTSTDPLRWKNLLNRVETTLRERGMPADEIAELLSPAVELLEDRLAWSYMSDGLAMFLRPGWHRMFRVPAAVPEVATVGDHFVVGPLLRLVTGDSHFLVLAVSQRRVRLLDGSRQRVEELEMADVPTALEDVIDPPESRSNTMTFPVSSGGRGGGTAVFYGHGASDNEFKRDQVRGFLRQVADGLRDYLTGQDLALVLVGLDEVVSLYREVNGYQFVLDEDVRHNADDLSNEELHAAAWPVVEAKLIAERENVMGRFRELHGTGRAVDDHEAIAQAAGHGRVETLFLASEPWCWEHVGSAVSVVELGRDDDFAHCELLDRVAVDTLNSGGRVYAVPEVPGDGDVAAILRY